MRLVVVVASRENKPLIRRISVGEHDDDVAEVIPLNFIPELAGVDPERVEVKRRSFHECLHRQTTIYADIREVHCKNCDRVLDPFDVLRELANEWQRDWFSLRHARKEAERLLDDAKRERKNAKASRRRAEKSATKGGC